MAQPTQALHGSVPCPALPCPALPITALPIMTRSHHHKLAMHVFTAAYVVHENKDVSFCL